MSTYYEQLKNPRWQKRRLQILNRANFACEWCGENEATLHVHHLYYLPGFKAWEYSDMALVALCADCHRQIAELQCKCEVLIRLALCEYAMEPEEILEGMSKLIEMSDIGMVKRGVLMAYEDFWGS